jgi:hypothetical protein
MKSLILFAFLAAAAMLLTGADIYRRKPAGLDGGWDFSGGRITAPNGAALSLYGNASVPVGTRYLALDGNGDYASCTLTASQTISISLWIYKTSSATEVPVQHFRISGNSSNASGIRIVMLSGGGCFADLYGDTGQLIGAFGVPYTINTWTHYCLTYNSGTLKIYQNGVLRNTTVGTNYTLTNGATMIGAWGSATPSFNLTGRVAGVMPFSRVLGDGEVSQIFNFGQARISNGGTP